jgi:hypothetical protein
MNTLLRQSEMTTGQLKKGKQEAGWYVDSGWTVRRWCVYGAYIVRINSVVDKNSGF